MPLKCVQWCIKKIGLNRQEIKKDFQKLKSLLLQTLCLLFLASCQTPNKCLSLSIPTPRVPTQTRTNKRSAEGGICLVMIRLGALLWVHASYTKSLTQFLLAHSFIFSCPKSLTPWAPFIIPIRNLLIFLLIPVQLHVALDRDCFLIHLPYASFHQFYLFA